MPALKHCKVPKYYDEDCKYNEKMLYVYLYLKLDV